MSILTYAEKQGLHRPIPTLTTLQFYMNKLEQRLRSQPEVGGHSRQRHVTSHVYDDCTALSRFNWYPLVQNGSGGPDYLSLSLCLSPSFLPLSAIHPRPVAKRRNLGEVEARAPALALP